jgi:hypothetical protein
LNGLLQNGELLFFDPSKLRHLPLLRGTGFRQPVKRSQSGIDLRGRFLVGLQVDWIIRNQISTLACFRIDHKAKNGTQLFLHFVVSLNLIVQSVVTHGGSAGVRYHPEGEEQPDRED